jgi:hypothetical protein
MAWSSPSFLGAGAVLVGADTGRVDGHVFRISINSQDSENAGENAAFARGLSGNVTLRQITPGNPIPVAINDGIDKQAVVHRGAANMALPPWQEVLDPGPLVVAQSVALHRSDSPLPTSHETLPVVG